jgi:hypothetical protein
VTDREGRWGASGTADDPRVALNHAGGNRTGALQLWLALWRLAGPRPLHVLVDGCGLPLRVVLSPGQASDKTAAAVEQESGFGCKLRARIQTCRRRALSQI